MLTNSQIDALIASSYNIHVGPVKGGDFMTPARAASLPREERLMLCELLAERGGSDLYSKQQAAEAIAIVGA